MGARYMDPQIGRFVTPDAYVQDSTDPQFLNRYAYARNNPIKFTDPTGNFAWVPFLIALSKVLAVIAKAAAVVSAAATTAQIIAKWAGHAHAAQTFGKIAGIAAIVSISASVGSMAAGGVANAQASIEVAAPPDPESPQPPSGTGRGEALGKALDKIADLTAKISVAVQAVDSVGRLIAKQIGSTVAYAAEVAKTSTILESSPQSNMSPDRMAINKALESISKTRFAQARRGRQILQALQVAFNEGRIVFGDLSTVDALGLHHRGRIVLDSKAIPQAKSTSFEGVLTHEGTHLVRFLQGAKRGFANEREAFNNGFRVDIESGQEGYLPTDGKIKKDYGFA
jgi:hypothetical protein